MCVCRAGLEDSQEWGEALLIQLRMQAVTSLALLTDSRELMLMVKARRARDLAQR